MDGLTFFDIIFFAVVGITVFISLFRGLTGELASLFNWLFSAYIASFITPYLSNVIATKIPIESLANVIAGSLSFSLVLIFISILTRSIKGFLNGIISREIDVPLGMIFGALKGYLIVGVGFVIILNIYGTTGNDTTGLPKWLTQAKTYPIIKPSEGLVKPLISRALGKNSNKIIIEKDENEQTNSFNYQEQADNLENQAKTAALEAAKNSVKATINEKVDNLGGYKQEQIDEMNQMLDIIMEEE